MNHKKILKAKIRLWCLLGLYGSLLVTSVFVSLRAGEEQASSTPSAAVQQQQVWLTRHLLQQPNDSSTAFSTSAERHPTTRTHDDLTNTTGRPVPSNVPDQENCTHPAIEDFPSDFFTPAQRVHGGILVHVIIGAYTLLIIAIACDDYFVPSLEGISEALSLSPDVAGATFMAAGSSAPELFTNVVGTFVTEGDLGVGTIVGSAVFNILGVTALCGLFVDEAIPVDFWALTRDCTFYLISVVLLILAIMNEVIYWYEGAIFLFFYLLYIVVMKYNSAIELKLKWWLAKQGVNVDKLNLQAADENVAREAFLSARPGPSYASYDVEFVSNSKASPVLHKSYESTGSGSGEEQRPTFRVSHDDGQHDTETITLLPKHPEDDDGDYWEELIVAPSKCIFALSYWVISWPARFLLKVTIPDCTTRKWNTWYPLTFTISILWIGFMSYITAWMITIIGHTLQIPDSVMGLTFLAAGTSVPEMVSSLVVARQGQGSMSISNLVGSNTFDILVCLGAPWLIKAFMSGQVLIASTGLVYSAAALLSTVVLMYGAMFATGFQLGRKVGFSCLLLYAVFLVLALLVELNVFGLVNLPVCPTTA
ncbi:unnamed protein product [Notodromas monacha]|uniref:Sodium/calcium exchanger membrane region domain-containing protein n=1 Tax=Notodromas monacha TaxID=399045 RepID=A0A7R9GE94_9CRUS|nr:unnamed protein product [Notodromas monacha]CAG0919524.1 unnamed protein product [Notodromas monacha]